MHGDAKDIHLDPPHRSTTVTNVPPSLPVPPAGSTVIASNDSTRNLQLVVLAVLAAATIAGLVANVWGVAIAAGLLCGAGWAVSNKSLIATYRWSDPELILPESTLQLGGRTEVIYRRRARRLTDVANSRVVCVLICDERVTYRQGTDVRTKKARVFEQPFDGQVSGTAWGFEAYVLIDVPVRAGAPTFDLGNNEVRWRIETEVSGSNMPGDSHTFDVNVRPVVAPSLRGVQDS